MNAGDHTDEPAPGLVQRRRQRHRTRILDVAERRFASEAFTAVRVEEIAAEADVSVGTLYQHFGNKDGLYLAVAERGLDRADEYVTRATEGLTSPLARLKAIGIAYVDLLIDFPSLARFFVSPTALPSDDDIQERVRAGIRYLYDGLSTEIAAGIAAGEVAQLDPGRLAAFLMGAWAGVIAISANDAAPRSARDGARETIREAIPVLMRGLRA